MSWHLQEAHINHNSNIKTVLTRHAQTFRKQSNPSSMAHFLLPYDGIIRKTNQVNIYLAEIRRKRLYGQMFNINGPKFND